jgi:hypothetical protein
LLTGTVSQAQTDPAPPVVPKAEQAKIFAAAGAVRRGKGWTLCAEGPNSQGASIEVYRDLNGDSRSDALVVDGSTFCYGMTGAGYVLLTRDAAGKWRVLDGGPGMVDFLKTRGVGGWPDMQIGGPGFCFPVLRWDGKVYKPHRHEYEGKRCKPTR